jgi:hypothetical protein
MAFTLKEGNGSLFKNNRKTAQEHPDYTGSIMLDGTERWLSAWLKESKNGKFLSVSIGKPKEAPKPKDDDLPY